MLRSFQLEETVVTKNWLLLTYNVPPEPAVRRIGLWRRLKKLQGWLEKINKLDFHGAPLAAEAAERLRNCETLLESYARRVFDAHDEHR